MTSPTLLLEPAPVVVRREPGRRVRIGLPALLFVLTMLSTTSVGMRYMQNFQAGLAPLAGDADILPYGWIAHNLRLLWTGLPFSLTLVGILLAHEFGHYFACRRFGVQSTLPCLLPAPSLSGTFGAVIRIRSLIRTRAALIVIGASGPIAGFVVAVAAVALGLSLSTYSATPLFEQVRPPLVILAVNALLQAVSGDHHQLALIVPHPVLVASWIGLLITALNLIPAGQLDGGHILYAVSPQAHRWTTRLVIATLFVLSIVCWAGWILWAIILLLPVMRHPAISDALPLSRGHYLLAPLCLLLLIACGTLAPFSGFSLTDLYLQLRSH